MLRVKYIVDGRCGSKADPVVNADSSARRVASALPSGRLSVNRASGGAAGLQERDCTPVVFDRILLARPSGSREFLLWNLRRRRSCLN